MKKIIVLWVAIFLIPFCVLAKKNIVSKEISYVVDGHVMKGFVYYDAKLRGKSAAVLVVHEWWGCNDYAKKRAKMIAELGYVGFAVDMYGDGKIATDPQTAKAYAAPFYANPQLALQNLNEAIAQLKKIQEVDPNHIAGIGYCFGGGVLLNMAKMGIDLKGVVSFHGSLKGVPAKTGTCKAEILVCHGSDDKAVSEEDLTHFKSDMQIAGIPYTLMVYQNATHAFTNPEATALGKKFNLPIAYNEKADRKSWREMKDFLAFVFDDHHEIGIRGK